MMRKPRILAGGIGLVFFGLMSVWNGQGGMLIQA